MVSMCKNYYVQEDNKVTSKPTETEDKKVNYTYVEPTIYKLDTNKIIVSDEINEQWEVLFKVSDFYISEYVSHDMQELKEFLKGKTFNVINEQ